MKKKDTENNLVVAQSSFEMLDNLIDQIMEASLGGATSEILSAIPGATITMGLIKGIRKYKDQKNYEKFISFIQHYKSNTDEKISKYLNDHPESELGEYTLSMIEDLTSVRQTEMFGRSVALLLKGEIDEDTFFEYGYIIERLDPHLSNLFTQVGEIRFEDIEYTNNSEQLMYLNLVVRIDNPMLNDRDLYPYAYKVSSLGKAFYNNVFKRK